tara:strand:- start:366 stop:725 length:360 start_codon:yes stop_codon:yes gene_type:complete
MEKVVLNKVIEWLKDEVKINKGVVDYTKHPITFGRHECAEGLLSLINKWKEEEKNKPRKTMTMADITEERRKNPEKYLSQYTIDEMKKLGLPIRRDNIPMDEMKRLSRELIIKLTDKEE